MNHVSKHLYKPVLLCCLMMLSVFARAECNFHPTGPACIRMTQVGYNCPKQQISLLEKVITISMRCIQTSPGDQNIAIYFAFTPYTFSQAFPLTWVGGGPYSYCAGSYGDYTLTEPQFLGDPCYQVPNPDFNVLAGILFDGDGNLPCPRTWSFYVNPDYNEPWAQPVGSFSSLFLDIPCCEDNQVNEAYLPVLPTCITTNQGGMFLKVTVPDGYANLYPYTIAVPTGLSNNAAMYLYYQDPVTNLWNYQGWLPAYRYQTAPGGDWYYYYYLDYVIPPVLPCIQYFLIVDQFHNDVHSSNNGYSTYSFGVSSNTIQTACSCCKSDFSISINTASPDNVNVSASNYDPAYTYQFDFGDGDVLNGPGFSYIYPASGGYDICLNSSTNEGAEECKHCLGVCVPEQKKNPDFNRCNAEFTFTYSTLDNWLSLNADDPAQAYTYEWWITDNTVYSLTNLSGPSASLNIDKTHQYTVLLQLTSGDAAICSRKFDVCPANQHGDGQRQAQNQNITVTGNKTSMKVYPNPATGTVYMDVNMPSAAAVHIELVNALGQTVYSRDVQAEAGYQKLSIPTANLANGIYNISLKTGATKLRSKVVIDN